MMTPRSLSTATDQLQPEPGDLAIDPGDAGALTSAVEDGPRVPLFSSGSLALTLIEALIGTPGLTVQYLVSRTVVGHAGDWWAVCVECRSVAGPVTTEQQAAALVCGVCEEREVSDRRARPLVARLRHVASVAKLNRINATAKS